jgi:hypothetical protein
MMMPRMPGGAPSSGGGRMLLGGPRDMDGRPAAVSTSKPLDNARLVELSIYAIASLYDRFPALKKETATTDTTPAAPAAKN